MPAEWRGHSFESFRELAAEMLVRSLRGFPGIARPFSKIFEELGPPSADPVAAEKAKGLSKAQRAAAARTRNREFKERKLEIAFYALRQVIAAKDTPLSATNALVLREWLRVLEEHLLFRIENKMDTMLPIGEESAALMAIVTPEWTQALRICLEEALQSKELDRFGKVEGNVLQLLAELAWLVDSVSFPQEPSANFTATPEARRGHFLSPTGVEVPIFRSRGVSSNATPQAPSSRHNPEEAGTRAPTTMLAPSFRAWSAPPAKKGQATYPPTWSKVQPKQARTQPFTATTQTAAPSGTAATRPSAPSISLRTARSVAGDWRTALGARAPTMTAKRVTFSPAVAPIASVRTTTAASTSAPASATSELAITPAEAVESWVGSISKGSTKFVDSLLIATRRFFDEKGAGRVSVSVHGKELRVRTAARLSALSYGMIAGERRLVPVCGAAIVVCWCRTFPLPPPQGRSHG